MPNVAERDERSLTEPAARYEAFISYSHALDGKLAPALQTECERFGKPWYRPRARRLFRDNANLSAQPHLWDAIESALSSSRWFVLLASPAAAGSHWVGKEVDWWLANRSADRILIVLTDGSLPWGSDPPPTDDPSSSALPPALAAAMTAEPRWVDLRWVRHAEQIDPANPSFRECVADISAAVSGVEKDTLVGEHVRRHRQTKRLVRTVIAVLSCLVVAAVVSAYTAVGQRNLARDQTLTATSRQLVAEASSIRDTQPDLARQLIAQAHRLSPTEQAVGAVLGSSSIPRVIRTRGLARGVAYGARRDLLAVATDQGVSLHDGRTRGRLTELDTSGRYAGAVAFSSDDRLLATGGADGTVRLRDVRASDKPVLLSSLPSPNGIVGTLTFAARAPVLAVGAQAAAVDVWNVEDPRSPKKLATIEGFATAGLRNGVAISADGRLLASAGESNTGRLWELSARRPPRLVGTLVGHGTGITAMAFSPDGALLASASEDDTTRLWDVTDPAEPAQRVVLTGHSLGVSAVAFAPDGAALATGSSDTTVQLWDISDPLRPKLGARLAGHADSITGLDYSADGQTLASASWDNTVRLWKVVASGRSTAQSRLSASHLSTPAFTPDSRTLAAGYPTTLWNLSDRARPRSLAVVPSFNRGGQAVAFSPDGKRLATGVPVVVWDASTRGQPRPLTQGPVTDGAVVVTFSPTAAIVAVGTYSGTVELWDLRDPRRPAHASTLRGSEAAPQGVAFRPDGRVLATLTPEGRIQLWDVGNASAPKLRGSPTAAAGEQLALAFSPDGRTLATGGADGAFSTWDVTNVSRPKRLATAGRHVGSVAGVAYHPDGAMVATAGEDGSVRLWNVAEQSRPTETAVLTAGGRFSSAAVAFSPDGRTLAAAAGGGTQLWDVDVDRILQSLCAESPAITRSQWAQYLPDRDYDPPCA
jgi:WD40 repeat protein